MRVIFPHDLTRHSCAFYRTTIIGVIQFAHREQYPPVNRFEPVPDIWQRARNDHAHRVTEKRLAQFVLDIYRRDIETSRRRPSWTRGHPPTRGHFRTLRVLVFRHQKKETSGHPVVESRCWGQGNFIMPRAPFWGNLGQPLIRFKTLFRYTRNDA
ncbi:MAG: hypothetical protein CM1200mP9_00460 [Gammaproteobacteria bacterium]|nr:MAG: hypothetical protein CM1200mP9_00460 [Gammaproteobacteria bacterium]